MSGVFEMLYETVRKTVGYWIGNAHEAYQSSYEKAETEQLQTALSNLKEYPVKLREMAGIYDEGEALNEQASVLLRNNLIM